MDTRFRSPLPGKIISLEGIDQSGKNTQARLLAQHLRRVGSKAAVISFPIYGSPSGQQIRGYLEGKRDYPPQALHMLYSLNRWENIASIVEQVDMNDFIIADRYTPSNLAYGVSKGLSLEWLQGLDKGLPPPRLVIVLDVSTYASFARKSNERDIHERDQKFLTAVRRTYKVLARKLDWETVDATQPVREVQASILRIVQQRFKMGKAGDL